MEAARTSESSVDNYFTLQYIPEYNSELHTRRRENLKSHNMPEVNESELWIAKDLEGIGGGIILMYYPSFRLAGLRKDTEYLSQDSRRRKLAET
jgi:hypothetical protein